MSFQDISNATPEKEFSTVTKLLENVDTNPFVGTSWYIVSKLWWDKWEGYVQNPEKNDPPGPIDASDILLPADEFEVDPSITNLAENNILKSGIRAENDYKLLSKEIWRLLKDKYGLADDRAEIKRYSIEVSEFLTQVEVGLRPNKFVWISKRGAGAVTISDVMTVYLSRKKDVKDVKKKIYNIYNGKVASATDKLYMSNEIRLWKLKGEMSLEEFKEWMTKNDKDANDNTKVEFPGEKLDEYDALEEIEMAYDDIYIAEIRGDMNTGWRFKFEDPFSGGYQYNYGIGGSSKPTCEGCRRIITGRAHSCGCK
jgi:hypothetical protein